MLSHWSFTTSEFVEKREKGLIDQDVLVEFGHLDHLDQLELPS